MLIRLIPLLLLFGCSSSTDNTMEIARLTHLSAMAINDATEIYYYKIKENAYADPERARPLLVKANKIESLCSGLNTYIAESQKSTVKPTRSALMEKYETTVEHISNILDIASYNIPEQYKFTIDSSTVNLDSVATPLLPSFITLNLALIKADVFLLLNALAPMVIECNFGNKVYVMDEEISNGELQFDLSSRFFSFHDKRYFTIDSSFRNGKAESLDATMMDRFTFGHVSIDSLQPGAYKVFGKVSAFPNGIEYEQTFSHEFVIPDE